MNCSDCKNYKVCKMWYDMCKNVIDKEHEELRYFVLEYGYDFKADTCNNFKKEVEDEIQES